MNTLSEELNKKSQELITQRQQLLEEMKNKEEELKKKHKNDLHLLIDEHINETNLLHAEVQKNIENQRRENEELTNM